MELALTLVIIVFLELAVTVWLLARNANDKKALAKVSKRLLAVENKVATLGMTPPTSSAPATQETPEGLQDAIDLLKRFGVDVEEK